MTELKITIGKRSYKVVPYVAKKCGDTENIKFRLYHSDTLVKEADDVKTLRDYFCGVFNDEVMKTVY